MNLKQFRDLIIELAHTIGSDIKKYNKQRILKDQPLGEDIHLGELVTLDNNGVWVKADRRDINLATGMLGIVLIPNTTPGTQYSDILVKGVFEHSNYDFQTSSVLYLAPSGLADDSPTTTSGEFVRIIGYKIDGTNRIFFDPDKTWVEIS